MQSTKSDTPGMVSFVTAMSKTSGLGEGLYGLVVGVSGRKIRQEFSSA